MRSKARRKQRAAATSARAGEWNGQGPGMRGAPVFVERDETHVGRGGRFCGSDWLPQRQNFPINRPVPKINNMIVVAVMPSATAARFLVSSLCRSRCVTVSTLL